MQKVDNVVSYLATGLLAIGIGGLATPTEAKAQTSPIGTCASTCVAKPIQFRPGDRIRIRVINRTNQRLWVERVAGKPPIELLPLQTMVFERGGTADPDASVLFWEETQTPLRAKLRQTGKRGLTIDLSFAAIKPGDQSLYIRSDGRVDLL